MHEWLIQNRNQEHKIVLLGDLNIAPLEHDVWSSKQLKYVVSHTDIERTKLMRNLTAFGFIDTARHLVPHSEKLYSWWSYRSPNWDASDRGRRLDHIWITPNLVANFTQIQHLRDIRGITQPSDHVPVLASL